MAACINNSAEYSKKVAFQCLSLSSLVSITKTNSICCVPFSLDQAHCSFRTDIYTYILHSLNELLTGDGSQRKMVLSSLSPVFDC